MKRKYVVDVPFSAKVRITIESDEVIRDGRLHDYIFEDGRKLFMRADVERAFSKISRGSFQYKFGSFLTRKIVTIHGSSGKRGTLDALLTQSEEESNEDS